MDGRFILPPACTHRADDSGAGLPFPCLTLTGPGPRNSHCRRSLTHRRHGTPPSHFSFWRRQPSQLQYPGKAPMSARGNQERMNLRLSLTLSPHACAPCRRRGAASAADGHRPMTPSVHLPKAQRQQQQQHSRRRLAMVSEVLANPQFSINDKSHSTFKTTCPMYYFELGRVRGEFGKGRWRSSRCRDQLGGNLFGDAAGEKVAYMVQRWPWNPVNPPSSCPSPLAAYAGKLGIF